MSAKAAVIINPAAGRGNGKGRALADALVGSNNANVYLLDGFHSLEAALEKCLQNGSSNIFISSGDGTIQAVQTFLAQRLHSLPLPRLCILSHGTTNLTAIDVGFQRRSISEQVAFINNPNPAQTKRRHSLHVLNAADGVPRHGLNFGAGAASHATRMTQLQFNDRGTTGQLAALRLVAGTAAKAIFLKPNHADQSRLDRPCRMSISQDGCIMADGEQLMFIATTLEKQFFNARLFWGGKNGPVRASVIAYPPPNLARWIWPLMYGPENRKLPEGCVSFSGDGFEIRCDDPFVMDGEFFNGPKDAPLQVRAGPLFEFIVG